ncbi:unnamed protein product [Brugia timori]|uniref:Secreted protein n=1 Tax=Brugia timori TaxID=42155 RepID=A0A0R3QQK3_9BILA|nr:unnamed protein product [Brugia timori]
MTIVVTIDTLDSLLCYLLLYVWFNIGWFDLQRFQNCVVVQGYVNDRDCLDFAEVSRFCISDCKRTCVFDFLFTRKSLDFIFK